MIGMGGSHLGQATVDEETAIRLIHEGPGCGSQWKIRALQDDGSTRRLAILTGSAPIARLCSNWLRNCLVEVWERGA